jgi:hypothetical protein
LLPGGPPARRIANTHEEGSFPVDALLSIADGMPRSLPFHNASVTFSHEQFGDLGTAGLPLSPIPGVVAGDSWWVNGRRRSLGVMYVVDGDPASTALQEPPPALGQLLSALGRPKKSGQLVLPDAPAPGEGAALGATLAPPADAIAVQEIVARYRATMADLVNGLDLPHDLPPHLAALGTATRAGPLKPALVSIFGPRGFDCRGESGVFTLRKRTPDHHVVDLVLDVGSWSRMVTALYRVQGPGFQATVPVPVAKGVGVAVQYPIGDQEQWERIVANLAAITAVLNASMLREIEAATGPAPEWFDPPR